MKKHRWFIALIVLMLASLACQTVMGGGANPPTVEFPTRVPVETGLPPANPSETSSGDSDTSEAGFPIPPDSTQVTDLGESLLTYQTDMSLNEVMNYYRDVLPQQGYTERTELTVTSDSTFSFVFDGHESGKALVIQGVDFGGNVTVSLSLQDI